MAISQSTPIATSSHLNEAFLKPFLQSTFDPAEYLNSVLPPLRLSNTSSKPAQTTSATLTEVSGQTQTLLSTLNAQATRLTNILTQLTDDILRTSSRLAYEVEILQAETSGLNEILEDDLKDDFEVFMPGGVPNKVHASSTTPPDDLTTVKSAPTLTSEPMYLTNLKTLTQVRTHLDTVIQLFGQALQFNIPPSLINPPTSTSSFISVSAPPADVATADAEQKGKESVEKLRAELLELCRAGAEGREKARERVEVLRALCGVWKGTMEEKARFGVVEELARLVESS